MDGVTETWQTAADRAFGHRFYAVNPQARAAGGIHEELHTKPLVGRELGAGGAIAVAGSLRQHSVARDDVYRGPGVLLDTETQLGVVVSTDSREYRSQRRRIYLHECADVEALGGDLRDYAGEAVGRDVKRSCAAVFLVAADLNQVCRGHVVGVVCHEGPLGWIRHTTAGALEVFAQ